MLTRRAAQAGHQREMHRVMGGMGGASSTQAMPTMGTAMIGHGSHSAHALSAPRGANAATVGAPAPPIRPKPVAPSPRVAPSMAAGLAPRSGLGPSGPPPRPLPPDRLPASTFRPSMHRQPKSARAYSTAPTNIKRVDTTTGARIFQGRYRPPGHAKPMAASHTAPPIDATANVSGGHSSARSSHRPSHDEFTAQVGDVQGDVLGDVPAGDGGVEDGADGAATAFAPTASSSMGHPPSACDAEPGSSAAVEADAALAAAASMINDDARLSAAMDVARRQQAALRATLEQIPANLAHAHGQRPDKLRNAPPHGWRDRVKQDSANAKVAKEVAAASLVGGVAGQHGKPLPKDWHRHAQKRAERSQQQLDKAQATHLSRQERGRDHQNLADSRMRGRAVDIDPVPRGAPRPTQARVDQLRPTQSARSRRDGQPPSMVAGLAPQPVGDISSLARRDPDAAARELLRRRLDCD